MIRGALESEDVVASRRLVQALGARLERSGSEWVLQSAPLREPAAPIDCGNSGTTMRLGAGLCVHQPGTAVLTGDASLSKRPMRRIVEPLRALGHRIEGASEGTLPPLQIRRGTARFAVIRPQVASAQVKSAALLAGRDTGVEVIEPGPSRDHTEILLRQMGAAIEGTLLRPGVWSCTDVAVPGDLSSAAFWIVLATLVAGSELVLPGVGVNPTRTGVLDVLRAMGADIGIETRAGEGGEPRADLVVRAAPLRGVRIEGERTLRAIDELPVLAVAAAFAESETVIADAGELRHKESDRIRRVVLGLRAMGAEVEETRDGMVVAGGGLAGGGDVDALGDHRLAMAFAVAGAASPHGVTLHHAEAVRTSYPAFFDELGKHTGALT